MQSVLRSCRLDEVNAVDSNGWSPLHWAAATGRASAVTMQHLLDADAYTSFEGFQGRNAINLAIAFAKTEEVAVLEGEGPQDGSSGTSQGRVPWYCDGCGDASEHPRSAIYI